MKVLFVTTESTMDHSFTMINELRKHIELDAVITAKELTPELEEYCKLLNVKFFRRKSFKNPFSIIYEIKLLFYLRRQKADVVWFNVLSVYQSLLAWLFFKKIIVNAHDIELHTDEKDMHGIISQKITFRFYRNSIAVMSKTQAELFKKKYGKNPFIFQLPVIDYYKSVSREKIQQNNYENTQAAGNSAQGKTAQGKTAQGNSAAGRTVKFFFFGSILPYKGIEKLLDAAEILEKRGGNAVINIYGKLKYDHLSITARIKKIKSINFVNEFIDYRDVCGLFSSNDVIIIPYIQVSQCGPLLIGYSMSVPAIAGNLPGFREYIDSSRSGLLFDNTVEGLAESMFSFINDTSVIDNMREYIDSEIRERFSMESLCSNYIKVFESVLNK